MAPSSSRVSPAFEKDEKCLCFHGPFLYEAKILDSQPIDPSDRKKGFEYRVHYKGWKNTWDDWVPEDRLRKPTEENKELAADLLKELKNQQREERDQKAAAKKANTSSKRKSQPADSGRREDDVNSTIQGSIRGTKRRRDSDLEKVCHELVPSLLEGSNKPSWDVAKNCEPSLMYKQEEAFNSKPAIKIHTSDLVKSLLVDDWEYVTKDKLLVQLPHQYPVKTLLADYHQYESSRRQDGSAESDLLLEFTDGLRTYFDSCLGTILLYRHERPQWLDAYDLMYRGADPKSPNHTLALRHDDKDIDLANKEPSDIYGAEHLCRLVISMPELIAKTNIDTPTVSRLRTEFNKLSKWLSKNADSCFLREYFDPGDEYRERARGGAPTEA